jgi:2-polyprenyl-3-methyl-5-hydroxy-6-metoxy-1,4-benzoquinol methylase
MSINIIQQQIAYYRARAGEYDEWFYRTGRYDRGEALNQRWFDEAGTVMQTLNQTPPVEHVLEIACGTGIWTRELLKIAQNITAVDASPEVIEINRQKLNAPNIDYQEQDIFLWQPEKQYDMVFFGFWLSHVPPEHLSEFLAKVHAALKPGGRLFIVDSRREVSSGAHNQNLPEGDSVLQERKLNDGQSFTIVKIFYEVDDLQRVLQEAGFTVNVRVTPHYFIYVEGERGETGSVSR